MLAQLSPTEAYRRVDFDARVEGASQEELILVCFEQFVSALGTAIHAADIADNALKSRSLTRALSAVTALQLGVSEDGGVAQALRQVYEGARRTILDSALQFDGARLKALREDFREIGQALRDA